MCAQLTVLPIADTGRGGDEVVWIVVRGSTGPDKCVYVHVDCSERK